MTAFNYPRHNMSIRVSDVLDDLLCSAAVSLRATKTDVVIYLLAQFLDPTGKITPDIEHLPKVLREDFEPKHYGKA